MQLCESERELFVQKEKRSIQLLPKLFRIKLFFLDLSLLKTKCNIRFLSFIILRTVHRKCDFFSFIFRIVINRN